MHWQHWHFIIWLQLVGYYSLTHLNPLKNTWVLIFSLAIQITELPCNLSIQSSFFLNFLTSFLSIFPLLLFLPCFSEIRYELGGQWIEMKTWGMQQPGMEAWGGWSNHWRKVHPSGCSELTDKSTEHHSNTRTYRHFICRMSVIVAHSLSHVSGSLQPHGLQHARLPCPSRSLEVWLNSCPLSRWSHPTISSSVASFSGLLFPSIRVFSNELALHIRWPSTGVSASASVLPINIQGLFPLGLTGLISLQSQGLSRVFSNSTVQKHQFFNAQLSLWSNSHICTWLLEKLQLWIYGPVSAKWCLYFLICCLGLS